MVPSLEAFLFFRCDKDLIRTVLDVDAVLMRRMNGGSVIV